jgi:hypothetical protein
MEGGRKGGWRKKREVELLLAIGVWVKGLLWEEARRRR